MHADVPERFNRSRARPNTLASDDMFSGRHHENSLTREMRKNGLPVAQKVGITVHYDGVIAGMYAADLLVENIVLVELKAVKTLDSSHHAQCLNYLAAAGLPLCLLLNFGNSRLEIRRLINGS